MEFKIFVSYSTKDLQHVELLKTELADTSLDIFIAEHSVNPSEEIAAKIKIAIKDCDLFLVIWSKNAKNSGWVSQEIGQANALGKQILPLSLDKKTPPSGFIETIKHIPMHEDIQQGIAQAKKIAMDAYTKKFALVQQRKQQKEQQESTNVVLGLGLLFFWIATRK